MPTHIYATRHNNSELHNMYEGIKCAHPGLHVDAENGIVMLNRNRKDRVALLCGSKAGYEPFGAGFVGEGMLTAYVSGTLDGPPKPKIITRVIQNLAELNHGGILVLLLNYPQQVLHFGLAIEKARLKGIMIESYVITDDCARTEEAELVGFEKNLALRQGLSGCSYVIKILGTMSTCGYCLWEILAQAMVLNFRMATIGFSTVACTLPGANKPVYEINEGEVVVGRGLQKADQGIGRINTSSLDGIIQAIIPKVLENSLLSEGTSCCVLINNLGSATNMELYAIANGIDLYFGELGICIERLYVGTVMTALNTKGALISILNCTNKPEWISSLDVPTEAFAWPGGRLSRESSKWPIREFQVDESINEPIKTPKGMILNSSESQIFKKCLIGACNTLIESEDVINKLNGLVGNGDCGSNIRKFAECLVERLQSMPCTDVSATFAACSSIVEEKMSGTIGTIYSLAFCGAALDSESWISCWDNAINQIMKNTSAKLGYRTLLDALVPAFEIFVNKILINGEVNWKNALEMAVKYAECGCFNTTEMQPKVGKALFAKKSRVDNMDAGAYGVYKWLQAVYNVLNEPPEEIKK